MESVGEVISKRESPAMSRLLMEQGRKFDYDSLWSAVQEQIKTHVDEQIYSAWLKPLRLGSCQQTAEGATHIEVLASNKFSCEHVKNNYGKLINSALEEVLKTNSLSLRFHVAAIKEKPNNRTIRKASLPERPVRENSKKSSALYEQSNLNPKYNFSNYVVGACNQLAHAIALRLTEDSSSKYNPLFIYGGVGLGKTHLVNAIGNASWRRGKKVLLVSSEKFVNELITAIRSNHMHRFKERFRSLDLLIIDDIQFLIGKERTQEEFFHTFNDLYHRRKQIVITSDKVPQELTGLEERLRTRFSSGLSTDLQVPDFETRVAILMKKSDLEGIHVPDDVARFLAETIDTNVRELEGALNRVQALSGLNNAPITMELAQEALKSLLPSRRRDLNMELIQDIVARAQNVSRSDLIGKRRTQNIALARHLAMFLCRKHTTHSYPEIGAIFGGRDHSTAIHSYKLIEKKIASEERFSVLVKDLEQKLFN